MEAMTRKKYGLAPEGVEGAMRLLYGTGREAYGLGAVTDNLDPEGKGRVRVSLERTAPGSESGWLPVLHRSAGSGRGMWILPEVGTQAVYVLTDAEGGEEVALCAGKAASLSTDDTLKTKAKGAIGIESDKEVKVSGKNVRMSGSKGVCAEGRQIAVEGDKVMGFDVHVMVVPAGTSTANVPLPHPFIGEMKEALSSDVKIGSKKCAVKGSKARHSDATHMQLPGTIQFQQSPKKEGEVTGGTSGKVKIDGKEAAVIGSTVTTCNDIGARDNSTIIAVGASMPMPTIINPLNTEKWKREREEEEKEKRPEFQNVKWAKTSAEVELSAGVRDIVDGDAVTLQVFPEGKGPEDGAAYARLPVTVKSGAASARWSYRADRREVLPEDNPRFTFTAHSAWCPWKKSENSLEVKLRRPEITRAEWRDKDGNATNKGLVGEPLKLYTEVKDFDEGQGVTLTIRDRQTGEEVFQTGVEVRDGIAEAEWTYHYNGDKLDAKPRFTFEVSAARCRKAKSNEVEIEGKVEVQFVDGDGHAVPNAKYTIYFNGKEYEYENGNLVKGKLEKEHLVPGIYEILLERDKEGNEETSEDKIDAPEDFERSVIHFREYGFIKKDLSMEKMNRVVLQIMKLNQSE